VTIIQIEMLLRQMQVTSAALAARACPLHHLCCKRETGSDGWRTSQLMCRSVEHRAVPGM